MKKLLLTAAVVASTVLIMGSAAQATLYNQSLASPSGNSADPGWFEGSGKSGGFTVSTNGTITIAMRAKLHGVSNVVHSPDGTYHVPLGPDLTNTSYAAWDFEFSISDCRKPPNCTGDILALLQDTTVTAINQTNGFNTTIPILTLVGDSAWGPSRENSILDNTEWVAQNSENLLRHDPIHVAYDEYAADKYYFEIQIHNSDGADILEDSIVVLPAYQQIATPEPASLALVGAGLFGVAAIRRRKTRDMIEDCN